LERNADDAMSKPALAATVTSTATAGTRGTHAAPTTPTPHGIENNKA